MSKLEKRIEEERDKVKRKRILNMKEKNLRESSFNNKIMLVGSKRSQKLFKNNNNKKKKGYKKELE